MGHWFAKCTDLQRRTKQLFLFTGGGSCWVSKSCMTLCDPIDCSMPGYPVIHYLPEFVQMHVHWVGDVIQPSHPWPSPSPPAFNLSQHQSFSKSHLFASAGQRIGASASAAVLPMNIQGLLPLGWTGLISFQSKALSRVFSSTTYQNHQLFGAQLSSWSNSHIHTWLEEKP